MSEMSFIQFLTPGASRNLGRTRSRGRRVLRALSQRTRQKETVPCWRRRPSTPGTPSRDRTHDETKPKGPPHLPNMDPQAAGHRSSASPEERRRLPLRWAIVLGIGVEAGVAAGLAGGVVAGLTVGIACTAALHAMLE